jgi:hypothetical protein
MIANINFENFIFVIIAFFALSFIYKIIKNGGFKGALFGSPINQTIGEVIESGKFIKSSLKIHQLANGKIGIELTSKTIGSYQVMPLSLTKIETENLISLLKSANDRV